MTPEHEELKRILIEAASITTQAGRESYLDKVCRGDAQLRAQIEQLLSAHDNSGDFLNESIQITPPQDFIQEGPGTIIGHYKLLEKIGEGGFGVVFMAEQLEPIHRTVALKIVKPGMDTRQVIARFEAERQALALMEHPNIAQVYDAGATETGRPFFVMELVHGVPITDYCDTNELSPNERLKLFMIVCSAVQHAHQKGIIHRDIKPSNILVMMHDGKPLPKVIDFGTAKALQEPLTEKTMFTAYGRLIGTPQYMSPEQAEFSVMDVDTRADIYSLGVLLYELLTGTTPFEAVQLRAAAFDEMMRIIRQDEPPKPSTRVNMLGQRVTEIVRHRQVDANLLQRSLRGDLDWIIMKALEKDPTRRYGTAIDLGEDIQRHLEHQPVLAGPPSRLYRAHKFMRRHKVGVALSATAALTLIVGLPVACIGFIQARQERVWSIQIETEQRRILECIAAGEPTAAEMIPMLEDGARIASERLGPDSKAHIWFLQRLAPCLGSTGHWKEARAAYQKLIETNPDDVDLWWKECVTALAEGELDIGRELSSEMLVRFSHSSDPWVYSRGAYVSLLCSDNPSNLEIAGELADRMQFSELPENWTRIFRGIYAFRMSNFVEAETLLQQVLSDPDPVPRCVAVYYTAMARHHRGEVESAKELLKEANRQFNEFLTISAQDIGWCTLCENIFIRAQAERLILGREVSPPVTAESLSEARQKMKVSDHASR